MSDTTDRFILLKIGDRSAFLVGKLVEESENDIVLHFPVIMTIGLDENEDIEINTSKWFPFCASDIVQIPKEAIVAIASPKQNIINHYLKFIAENPGICDESLENEAIGNSPIQPKARDSEWMPSNAIH